MTDRMRTSLAVHQIDASFVMTVVAEEDASHAIWPSCPARGWSAGVEKLTARPVRGAELVPHLLSERTLETHGPCASVTFSTSLRFAASAARDFVGQYFSRPRKYILCEPAGEHLTHIFASRWLLDHAWT